eukprot:1147864-Pelagomonas_calceolata.AAC.8
MGSWAMQNSIGLGFSNKLEGCIGASYLCFVACFAFSEFMAFRKYILGSSVEYSEKTHNRAMCLCLLHFILQKDQSSHTKHDKGDQSARHLSRGSSSLARMQLERAAEGR